MSKIESSGIISYDVWRYGPISRLELATVLNYGKGTRTFALCLNDSRSKGDPDAKLCTSETAFDAERDLDALILLIIFCRRLDAKKPADNMFLLVSDSTKQQLFFLTQYKSDKKLILLQYNQLTLLRSGIMTWWIGCHLEITCPPNGHEHGF